MRRISNTPQRETIDGNAADDILMVNPGKQESIAFLAQKQYKRSHTQRNWERVYHNTGTIYKTIIPLG